MSISIEKLTKYIDRCNFYVNTYYGIKGRCLYIDVVSKNNGNNYLLYVPSKYKVMLDRVMSYELKEISNITNTRDVTMEYGFNKNNNFDEMYNMLDVNKGDVDENVLETNYKRDIKIDDVKSKMNEEVKCIYRQMSRFKYSVENLKYKLSIVYNSYLCVINRNNDIIYYYIKNINNISNKKSLLVCFDLEILYDKNYVIHTELVDVKNKMEKLLYKNYMININITNKLTDNMVSVDSVKQLVEMKKNKIDEEYTELQTKLSSIIVKESLIRDNLKSDVDNVEYKVRLKDVLREKGTKLIEMINMISKRDDLILRCDSILFDNIVMLDKISKNLKLLRQL